MEFGQKLSVEDFKQAIGVSTLQVIRNPKTDKLFVSANGQTVAAVSKNYDAAKPKEFVELKYDDVNGDPATVWCLHNANTDNVEETL